MSQNRLSCDGQVVMHAQSLMNCVISSKFNVPKIIEVSAF